MSATINPTFDRKKQNNKLIEKEMIGTLKNKQKLHIGLWEIVRSSDSLAMLWKLNLNLLVTRSLPSEDQGEETTTV